MMFAVVAIFPVGGATLAWSAMAGSGLASNASPRRTSPVP